MSDYTKLTKHPKTGKWLPAHWLDNYFGRHNYGVKFKGEPVIRANDKYLRVKHEPKYYPPYDENDPFIVQSDDIKESFHLDEDNAKLALKCIKYVMEKDPTFVYNNFNNQLKKKEASLSNLCGDLSEWLKNQ